jgi:exopolyphosphatase/guanosine-5'-triphosphate,3'-diphosphate pyrophosphatase
VRLLVADVIEHRAHPVIKKQTLVRVPIRLGADVFSGGTISNARCDHLIKSLKAFRLLTEVYGAHYMRCCATSAMREAANREQVLARVEMETGVHIEVISGRKEAKLIMHTFWTQDLSAEKDYLYIDVGGGSTEITVLRRGRRSESASFPIGTVRMLGGQVDEAAWTDLADFLAQVGATGLEAIGTGGNINRLFKENGNAHGTPLLRADIQRHHDRIAGHSLKDRVNVLRLRPDRADVIVPAASIFVRILELADVDRVHVPKVGLADGIVYDLYMKRRGHLHYPTRVA